ncbi:glycine/D-amino acid oxidase-like deaminating enzyme [Arthrobacter sp. V1I7]|uniref:NAD(P)/FAD-dependent oxidoreductase n=1 Tax=Arthrobacter sp. V1I7 TaxID=3042274 RepID=UPI00277F316E|nr:FAD-dependent oxidoreductase [Arthrobacter sp. V1I7]MDQ0821235.1 glycine/D-amino acid oxidase-like deaminating enzyme [Arthrobacter sp. V1I7]
MTSLWLDTAGLFITDPLIPESRYDAVVVGAGITGLSSALLLARSGMKVAVLEARTVGAGTTGHTTAKLSLLQGTVLSALRRQYPQKVVTAYVEANREGQAWLLRFLAERGVPFQQRDAYTYSVTDGGSERVAAELTVAKAAGLDVEEGVDTELPFATRRTIALRGQAQFNPMDVLGALAGDFRDHGGVLVQGARVRNVKTGAGAAVETDAGTIHADLVVLATGVPILDRGLYFAKLKASQSYAAALRLPASAPIPSGMYLSAETPGRSLRSYPAAAGELLVVGGNGHQVGREPSPRRRLDELLDWARFHFPGAEVTHSLVRRGLPGHQPDALHRQTPARRRKDLLRDRLQQVGDEQQHCRRPGPQRPDPGRKSALGAHHPPARHLAGRSRGGDHAERGCGQDPGGELGESRTGRPRKCPHRPGGRRGNGSQEGPQTGGGVHCRGRHVQAVRCLHPSRRARELE